MCWLRFEHFLSHCTDLMTAEPSIIIRSIMSELTVTNRFLLDAQVSELLNARLGYKMV